jgi:hypothetical protein
MVLYTDTEKVNWATNIEDLRILCVNREWSNTKIYTWTEIFGKSDLIGMA